MPQKIANILRFFWGSVFLLGVVINIAIGSLDTNLYDNGGLYAWPSFLHTFWIDVVVPHMILFIILYAIIELILGLLILNKGIYVKIGLVGALIFGAGLLMLGLGAKQNDWVARVPNLVFEGTILYCLFFSYSKTLWETIRKKKPEVRTNVIGG